MSELDIEAIRAGVDARLTDADAALAAQYPGDTGGRQPVHTVYVPADRFHADVAARWGEAATAALDEHEIAFIEVAGGSELERVRDKLRREPIEDVRIDFEDGYGAPDDSTEDAHALRAAAALAEAQRSGTAPPFTGIRIKSLEAPTRARGLRTLGLVLEELVTVGATFESFVVTLPKVTSVDQVEAMAYVLAEMEAALRLGRGSLRFEIQVETPQAVLGPDGTALVARMIHAASGRCSGLHFGTYDYTAFVGIAARYQSAAHPAAEHAKLVMQAAAAGTGVRVSDGSTNVLPVGERDAVAAGWRRHLAFVRRSLEHGFYQGWDLHPAQLPTRFAATYGFFRQGFPDAAERLARYTGNSAGESAVADEPATARALADSLVRALDCGAVSAREVADGTGLDEPAVRRLARPGR
jgi:citrate lyase beta subunit